MHVPSCCNIVNHIALLAEPDSSRRCNQLSHSAHVLGQAGHDTAVGPAATCVGTRQPGASRPRACTEQVRAPPPARACGQLAGVHTAGHAV